jgi:hypothetical protein
MLSPTEAESEGIMSQEGKADIVNLADRFTSKSNRWFRMRVEDVRYVMPRGTVVGVVGSFIKDTDNILENYAGIAIGPDNLETVFPSKKGEIIEFQLGTAKTYGDIDGDEVVYISSVNIRSVQDRSEKKAEIIQLFSPKI